MRHAAIALRTSTYALLLVLAFANTTAALAAEDVPAPGEITELQSKQLQQLSARVDQRLNAGLAGSEREAEQMRSELKQIAALKEPSAVAKAVTAYQARHAAFHSALMSRSGVSLEAVAKEMQQIVPALRFEAKPNGTIVGSLSTPGPAATPTIPPASGAKTVTLSGLVSESTTTCGAIAGGSSRFTANSVESRANATLIGQCSSKGSLRKVLDTAGARAATLSTIHDRSVDLSAVSIVGTSSASAVLALWLDSNAHSSSSHFIWAPLLWAASEHANAIDLPVRLVVPMTGVHQLRLTTQVATSAVAGAATQGKVSVRNVEATLELEF